MLEALDTFDKKLLVFLNGLHIDFLDQPMYYLSKKIPWVIFALLMLYFAIRKFQWGAWELVVGFALVFLIADGISSGLAKPFFERLRPSRAPDLDGLLHLVNGYRGGKYGFFSSHAANSFGLATFCFFYFKGFMSRVWLVFLWASIITYTRIYLGVHYPFDILTGVIWGVFCGFVVYKLILYIREREYFGFFKWKEFFDKND